MTLPKIAETKNQWLYQQVDVEFPTKESIAGMELYKAAVTQRQYQLMAQVPTQDGTFADEDIYLVDFHRLTVMFSLLQAGMWSSEPEQQLIVEFLTQIIYSEPCSLYLGFKDGEAVAAAIVTVEPESVLVSDVAIKSESANMMKNAFVAALCSKLNVVIDQNNALYLEE